MLDIFVTLCPLEEMAEALTKSYEGLADRLTVYTPFEPGERTEQWAELRKNIN